MTFVRLKVFAAILVGALGGVGGEARAMLLTGLTAANHLVTFDGATPGVISSDLLVTGLQTGERIVSIDRRPLNGKLYGVGSANHLYTIDRASGAAALVGGAFAVPLSGTKFSVDFNAEYDQLRLVSNSSQNLRIDPMTGQVVDFDSATPGVQADANLIYAAGDPNAGRIPNIVSKAYDNNFAGAADSTMYDIDSVLDILVFQGGNPGSGSGDPGGSPLNPNLGVLTTIGSLGFNTTEYAELEIVDFNTAFAVMTAPGSPVSQLFSIDLLSGHATVVGIIGGGQLLLGITSVAEVSEPETWMLLCLGCAALFAKRRRGALFGLRPGNTTVST